MIKIEKDNVRFSLHQSGSMWVFNAQRISDEHHLPGQMLFGEDPSEWMEDLMAMWWRDHPGLGVEPPSHHCYACGAKLTSDWDTDYQFDNALWIGLHGGYAMFVDACDFPTNTEDRWLRNPDGEYVLGPDERLVDNPDWVPEYEEPRVLACRPDEEAVICHECAHASCEALPWLARLIEPERSHAHPHDQVERLRAEGHKGWDLEPR